MASQSRKFPETRAWGICNNFNQRIIRVQAVRRKRARQEPVRQFTTWNLTSRRLYRYFFYKIHEVPPSTRIRAKRSPWTLRIQGLIRELRRRNGDYRRRWQRRIFQVLELWSRSAKTLRQKRDDAWQTRMQILISANYWLRRQGTKPAGPQTWTNVLWRAAHLKQRKSEKAPESAWQVRLRIIAATRFRTRTQGWNRTHNRIVQSFNSNLKRAK
ncbi:hypothetical protein Turpa_3577 [Turneriella parva DSM 21527]|uniref:Uncharacterized protein n=1 Tax=Turneriella parva (strain ATCC BAA-1111 / DSM 21527 / NCTC 11395 / H) TaxID=869212 RepID=I4BAA4_TURPD|nr:hypothetical protein Turpa_3577 [Turneriella parva DSM 21527]